VESERTSLVSERVSRLRRCRRLLPSSASSSVERTRTGSALLLRMGSPGDGCDALSISKSTPLTVRIVEETEDVEATLGGLVSSTALLLYSKFSVNAGILLRDLVVTLLGAGEVVATFLEDEEAVVAFAIGARPL